MTQDPKHAANELARAIQRLHRSLLMIEARILATETGRELTPYELLHASLNDPRLAWLRGLSALIVEIDTLVDETPALGATEASAVASRVLDLVDVPPETTPSEFWTRYTARLAAEPDLILQHARVKDLALALRPRM